MQSEMDTKLLISPDLMGLLQREEYSELSRINVVQRSEPQQIFENSESTFVIQNQGKGAAYNDLRQSYITCDISAINATPEVPEIGKVKFTQNGGEYQAPTVTPNGAALFTLEFAGKVIYNPLDPSGMFSTTLTFAQITPIVQAFFAVNFPEYTFTDLSVDTSFSAFSAQPINSRYEYRYSISGFSVNDAPTPSSVNYKFLLRNHNIVGGGQYLGTFCVQLPGTLAYPRMVWNSGSLIQNCYLKFGSSSPILGNANIWNNLMVLSEDTLIDSAFVYSRGLSQVGLNISSGPRRIMIIPYCLPQLNEMIVPSFVRDQIEIHLFFESASRCLSRSNINQSYQITNLKFNFYKLTVHPSLDDRLYQHALEGNMVINYHNVQNIASNIEANSNQKTTPITYTFRQCEKVFAVMHPISSFNASFDSFKLSRFTRNGLQAYRFQSEPGITFPKENILILNNDIAEAQHEYLRTISLPQIKRKYEHGLRTDCRALLNYRGEAARFDNVVNKVIAPSFIIGINTNYSSPEYITNPTACDSSVATAGGSGTALIMDQLNNGAESLNLYIFLYYCGQFRITKDLYVMNYF